MTNKYIKEFREACEKILKEKRLTGKELDSAMTNDDEYTERKYFAGKNRNDLNDNGNKYAGYTKDKIDEIFEQEKQKEIEREQQRQLKIIEKSKHLTQKDIEDLMIPYIGERTNEIYIPVRNNDGKINIYELDYDFWYYINNKNVSDLSKKELFKLLTKSETNLTDQQAFLFKYNNELERMRNTKNENILYVAKTLENIEKNNEYEEVFNVKKLYFLVLSFLSSFTSLDWEERVTDNKDDKIFLIRIPKKERSINKEYQAFCDFIYNIGEKANEEKQILGIDQNNDEYTFIVISDNIKKYVE